MDTELKQEFAELRACASSAVNNANCEGACKCILLALDNLVRRIESLEAVAPDTEPSRDESRPDQ